MRTKEFIKNNPYRMLGVATTDSSTDMMSHNSRVKAFASIGKSISFPFDFDRVFEEKPERGADKLNSAIAALSSPEGRLRHGMFWFMNITDTDAKALAALAQDGDIKAARSIWEQGFPDMSSVQNQLVCNLLIGPNTYIRAIQDAFFLYVRYGREFITTVCGGIDVTTSDKLLPMFMEEIVKGVGDDIHLWDLAVKRYNSPTYNNLWTEAEAAPLIKKLQDALNVAQSAERHTPQDHLDIAQRLMTQTEPLLKALKALAATYPKLLSRYATITDIVAEEVLNRVITYHNRSNWHPRRVERLMPLYCFCYRHACSVRFKDRCQKNINTILGRREKAPLFPNGKPERLIFESERKKRNEGISAIMALLGAI